MKISTIVRNLGYLFLILVTAVIIFKMWHEQNYRVSSPSIVWVNSEIGEREATEQPQMKKPLIVLAKDVAYGHLQGATSPEIFKERKDRVNKFCASHSVRGGISGVYTNSKAGVIYCFVPKTGCTFWKQMFLYQYMKQSRLLDSPWNLTKLTVHTGNKYVSGFAFKAAEHSPDRYPTRLLVTRDPFSRLLSSYLDKVYLPDFWRFTHKYATQAYQVFIQRKSRGSVPQDFLRSHFDAMARRFEPQVMKAHNSTAYYQSSAKYLTFEGFVMGTLKHAEVHWMPVHAVCNPCTFKPTHVSKTETLSADAKVILGKMNMTQFLDGFDEKEQVTQELKTIIDYNFKRWKIGPGSFMSGYPEFAFRLWNNFQWRGYIHPNVEYIVPQNTTAANIQKDLFQQIWKARELGLQDPQAMKEYKKQFKLEAYKTLDKRLFNAVVSKYSMDFTMFGYEESLNEMENELFAP